MDKSQHDIRPKSKPVSRPAVISVPSYTDTTSLTPKSVRRSPDTSTEDIPRWLTHTLTVLAYGIPLAFLAYVLYINYLPFGYNKTFTIDVGAEGDTSVGEFYLEPSPDLSERKTAPDGTTYRELNGMANVIFKPNVVLKDAEITVSVEGEGVEIIPPVIDFNPDDYEWDYEWDFTKKETAFTPKVSDRARADWVSCTTTASTTDAATSTSQEESTETSTSTASDVVCEQIPVPDLVGNAFWFDDKLTFNGQDTRLEMSGTADMFEDGPFMIYVEWIPTENTKDFQQIIGHYNWEILQNKESVSFQIGRMNNASGTFYTINAPTTNFTFGIKQKILAIYKPYDSKNLNGYIELYFNDKFIDRIFIKDSIIWQDYWDRNLSFGKGYHGKSRNFGGSITYASVTFQYLNAAKNTVFNINDSRSYKLFTNQKAKIDNIQLNVYDK